MIRACTEADFAAILAVINDGARAYGGAIPADRWHEPYMAAGELAREIAAGVAVSGFYDAGPPERALVGVMGIQPVSDVTLIRHAYVRTSHQRRGIGGQLLHALAAATDRPLLIGTWAAATWATRFYQSHGFHLIEGAEKDRLLETYWSIPARQVETSVVLADRRWFAGDRVS